MNAPRVKPWGANGFNRPPCTEPTPASLHFLHAIIALAIFGTLWTPSGFAAVRYVNRNNTTPSPPYSDWVIAATSLQGAVDVAAPGDSIWVAAGTYFESVRVTNVLALYGGFCGTETALHQRNPGANSTILDGGQTNRVVSFTGGSTNFARLDGFIIQNGKAPAEDLSGVGAGIYVANASPVICNNIIRSNATGFSSALAYKQGGGMYVFRGSCVISNNIITHNRAVSGGGIYCYADCLICNNRFEGNAAEYIRPATGGSLFGGGGIYVSASQPQIINNLFLANIATNVPGDLYNSGGYGGAMCMNAAAAPDIVGNTMLRNLAVNTSPGFPDWGGGIYSESSKGVIANNLIALGSSGVLLAAWPGTTYGDRFRNNCVFGNLINYVTTDLTGTNGNISADPLLAASDDFHLSPQSPCIDAGNSGVVFPGAVDMDGQTRIAGPAVDIGADEYGSALPFAHSLRVQGPTVVLTLNAEPNRTYVCEASTNLTTWIAVCTNRATSSTLEFSLPVVERGLWLFRAKTSP